jgi:sentrin-specific protease 1
MSKRSEDINSLAISDNNSNNVQCKLTEIDEKLVSSIPKRDENVSIDLTNDDDVVVSSKFLVKKFDFGLTKEDLATVEQKNNLLNDNIINYYGKLCTEFNERCFFFDSFAYLNWTDKKFSAVKDRLEKNNIILSSYDYLLIPIHIQLPYKHWSLVFVDIPKKTCTHLDSNNNPMPNIIKICKEGLKLLNHVLFDIGSWGAQKLNVPKQSNAHDCGIFVCLYMRFILNNDLKFNFNQVNAIEFRSQLYSELTNGSLNVIKF